MYYGQGKNSNSHVCKESIVKIIIQMVLSYITVVCGHFFSMIFNVKRKLEYLDGLMRHQTYIHGTNQESRSFPHELL